MSAGILVWPRCTGTALSVGEVHLWRARGSAIAADMPLDCLTPAEQQRAASLLLPVRRTAFRIARTMLRVVLGRYLSADPASLRLAVGPSGKPFLPGQPLQFNLSHCEDAILLAVTRTRPVGVDVENLARRLDTGALARASLGPAEQDSLALLPASHARRAVLRQWTRKEALLKASGSGLVADPRALSLPLTALPARVCHANRAWTLADLPLGDAWQASLAVAGEVMSMRRYCLGWRDA